MSLRCGVDMVDVERVARMHRKHGRKAIRWLDEREYHLAAERAESFAAYFAAKEAAAKALGTGLCGEKRLRFEELKIHKDHLGSPQISLHGRAAERAAELGAVDITLSLTHEKGLALAFCVMSCRSGGEAEKRHA